MPGFSLAAAKNLTAAAVTIALAGNPPLGPQREPLLSVQPQPTRHGPRDGTARHPLAKANSPGHHLRTVLYRLTGTKTTQPTRMSRAQFTVTDRRGYVKSFTLAISAAALLAVSAAHDPWSQYSCEKEQLSYKLPSAWQVQNEHNLEETSAASANVGPLNPPPGGAGNAL
jgi:hypothetical protein